MNCYRAQIRAIKKSISSHQIYMLAVMTWLFLCMANNCDLNMHDFIAISGVQSFHLILNEKNQWKIMPPIKLQSKRILKSLSANTAYLFVEINLPTWSLCTWMLTQPRPYWGATCISASEPIFVNSAIVIALSALRDWGKWVMTSLESSPRKKWHFLPLN